MPPGVRDMRLGLGDERLGEDGGYGERVALFGVEGASMVRRCVGGWPSSARARAFPTDEMGILLSVLVGLGTRLLALGLADPAPNDVGIPSFIPSSTVISRSRLGRGRPLSCLDIPLSKLDLFGIFDGVNGCGGGDVAAAAIVGSNRSG